MPKTRREHVQNIGLKVRREVELVLLNRVSESTLLL